MIFFNSNLFEETDIIGASNQYLITKNGRKLFDTNLSSGCLPFGHENINLKLSMLPENSFSNSPSFQKELIDELVDFSIGGIGLQTSGSSAIMRACRLARAVTSRDRIAVIGSYWHGSDDEFIYNHRDLYISDGVPIPSDPLIINYNSIDEFIATASLSSYAAVLVEPYPGSNPGKNQLASLSKEDNRNLLTDNGVLLICDEIITGFREKYGSCNSSRNAMPDIVVFGKAISAGYPTGVVVCSQDLADCISNKKLFWGGTFSASASQLNQVFKTLNRLKKLDYNLINRNFKVLIKRIYRELPINECVIVNGCSYGKIKMSDHEFDQPRGFLGKLDFANRIRSRLKSSGIYVGQNLLIFPSIFTIEL